MQDGNGEETKESDRKARQVMISRLTKIIPIRNQAQMGLIKNADAKDLDAAAAANYDVKLIDKALMKCKLVHGSKFRSKDLIVTAVPDDAAKKVEWDVVKPDGTPTKMPTVLVLALEEFKPFDKKRHTFSCLLLALNLIKDASSSLRTKEEVDSKI